MAWPSREKSRDVQEISRYISEVNEWYKSGKDSYYSTVWNSNRKSLTTC